MTELSPTTKALLRTARGDGPSAAARSRILGNLAAGTGAASGLGRASLRAAAKGTLATGTAKLLVAGALFGSTVTVGIAAMLLRVGTPKLAPDPMYSVQGDTEISSIAPAARSISFDDTIAPKPAARAVLAKHAVAAVEPTQVPPAAPESDPLAREAALVAEARSALVRGEAGAALGALSATEALPSRAMEPEELSLQARAFHALGRNPEAAFVEEQLRARFPDNALAR